MLFYVHYADLGTVSNMRFTLRFNIASPCASQNRIIEMQECVKGMLI